MKSDSITIKNSLHGETKGTSIEKKLTGKRSKCLEVCYKCSCSVDQSGSQLHVRKIDGNGGKVTIKCSFTWNQSIVQQLMREGNILIRLLNASPMGLIANTTCRLARTRSMKKLYMASGVDSILRPWKQKDEKVTHLGRTNSTGHKITSWRSNQSLHTHAALDCE